MSRILPLLALLGCGGAPCDGDNPCAFGEACVAGECVAQYCATSAQCAMEAHCDRGACVEGCARDEDCYTGDACEVETGSCVPAACEVTALDCGYREFCDQGTGDCYDAGDLYCRPCSDDGACGQGNICWNRHCGVDCSDGRECPSGFVCTDFLSDDEVVVAHQCIAPCDLLEDLQAGEALPPGLEGPPVCLLEGP